MSDIICANCRGESTSGCWVCNPSIHAHPPMNIPLPDKDWDITVFRAHIAKLESEVKRLSEWLDAVRGLPRYSQRGTQQIHHVDGEYFLAANVLRAIGDKGE